MKNAKHFQFLADYGKKISRQQVEARYDVFHVEDVCDASGNHIGYELTAPAVLHRNVGFQNSVQPADFTLRMPSQQFIVDGVAHWPFEALNLKLQVEPAYHDVATNLARKAFGGNALKHLHYGVMPGVVNYIDGNPVFEVSAEHADSVLFYADQQLTAFAGFHRFNCIDLGAVQILLLPGAIAEELIA